MSTATYAPSVRAAVFALVCTLLAVGAHLPMATAHVPFAAMAAGAVAVFAVARAAAGAERGLASITALVGGCQFGLHFLFDAVQSRAAAMPGTAAPTASMGSMAGMPSTAQDPLAALSMAPWPGDAPHPAAGASMGLSAGMTLAHVLAALVAAWWLRRGEAAVFTGARWAGALLSTSWRTLAWLLAAPVPAVAPATEAGPRDTDTPSRLRSRLIRFVVIGRGPPAIPAG